MQCCLCYSNKYNEIKMCDLEPFSEIQSHIVSVQMLGNANHCTSCYNQCLTICKQYVVNGVGHTYLIAFMTVCVPGICGITAAYVAELRENGLVTYCIVPHIGRQGKHWQIW